ncbi:uncharacterized protein A4U43_C03F28610 [Asparagus officinalis]|uniref:Uncharacterized protein n=1 Tax=Asparagus officinalis TaxID=4686 RepID=A0A5P1FHW9_ASPOF|nr:uncharacterized protein A4U43_C03F28610 [Asparagus officinalis]
MALARTCAAVATPAKPRSASAPKKPRSAPRSSYIDAERRSFAEGEDWIEPLRKLTAGVSSHQTKHLKTQDSYSSPRARRSPPPRPPSLKLAAAAGKPSLRSQAASAKTKATKVKSAVKKAAKPKSRPSAERRAVPAKKAAAAAERKAAAMPAKPKERRL